MIYKVYYIQDFLIVFHFFLLARVAILFFERDKEIFSYSAGLNLVNFTHLLILYKKNDPKFGIGEFSAAMVGFVGVIALKFNSTEQMWNIFLLSLLCLVSTLKQMRDEDALRPEFGFGRG